MKKTATAVIGIMLIFLTFFAYAADGPDTITIIHINDSHSHMAGQPITVRNDGKYTKIDAGGMVYAATVIKELKQQNPDALVLHAGDAMQGSLYFNLFGGSPDAAVLDSIGFDAITPGNHDFDSGDTQLAEFISLLNFPAVSSNILSAQDGPLAGKLKPYIIRTMADGQRIGIIGVTVVNKTVQSSNPGPDVSFIDEITAVQQSVDELKLQNVDRIIVLSHLGYNHDIRLANKVSDVDVIVGGDSHTLLGSLGQYGLPSQGSYPTITVNKNGKKVCIVQAWEYAKAVGELHVSFSGGSVRSCYGTEHIVAAMDNAGQTLANVPVFSVVNADQAAIHALTPYALRIEHAKQTNVGEAAQDMRNIRVPDSTGGSDIAPLVAKAVYDKTPGTDISIQNAGAVRTDLPKGSVTLYQVYSLLPYKDMICTIALTGAEIRQMLEDAVTSAASGRTTGGFPYAYGMRYDIDMSKRGRKAVHVLNIEVKDRTSGLWAPIDDGREYNVAVNDFTLSGKDGYSVLARAVASGRQKTDTGLEYASVFADYLRSLADRHSALDKLPAGDYPVKSYKK